MTQQTVVQTNDSRVPQAEQLQRETMISIVQSLLSPIGQLFFIRRLPRFVRFDWNKKKQHLDKLYSVYLEESGFISDIKANHFSEVVQQDIEDLNKILMEHYHQKNQLALGFQNLYYWFQYILVLGSFITTISSTISIIFVAQGAIGTDVARLIVTFAVFAGAVTTIATTMEKFFKPRVKWYRYRRTTEALRSHYFLYLSHLPPYDLDTRFDQLRKNVADLIEPQQKGK